MNAEPTSLQTQPDRRSNFSGKLFIGFIIIAFYVGGAYYLSYSISHHKRPDISFHQLAILPPHTEPVEYILRTPNADELDVAEGIRFSLELRGHRISPEPVSLPPFSLRVLDVTTQQTMFEAAPTAKPIRWHEPFFGLHLLDITGKPYQKPFQHNHEYRVIFQWQEPPAIIENKKWVLHWSHFRWIDMAVRSDS